jgi:predicted LPLAT superfamily acyltransferase
MTDRLILLLALTGIIYGLGHMFGIGFGIGVVLVILAVSHEERRAKRQMIELRHDVRTAIWRAGERSFSRRPHR